MLMELDQNKVQTKSIWMNLLKKSHTSIKWIDMAGIQQVNLIKERCQVNSVVYLISTEKEDLNRQAKLMLCRGKSNAS